MPTVYQVKVYTPPQTRPRTVLDFCSPKHRREWVQWERKDEDYLVCDYRTPITCECWWCGSLVTPD